MQDGKWTVRLHDGLTAVAPAEHMHRQPPGATSATTASPSSSVTLPARVDNAANLPKGPTEADIDAFLENCLMKYDIHSHGVTHFLAETRGTVSPLSRPGVAKLQSILLSRIRNTDVYLREVQGEATTSDDTAADVAAEEWASAAGTARRFRNFALAIAMEWEIYLADTYTLLQAGYESVHPWRTGRKVR